MESHRTSKTRHAFPLALHAAGGTLAACLLLAASQATAETVVTGQSDTILRIGRNSENKFVSPAYEYLRLGIMSTDAKGGMLSANFGGWGRFDPEGRMNDGNGKFDSDFQYGYISYQAAKNNLVATVGRQFVTEGVASDRLDGIYLRSDIGSGFAASAYAGNTVVTEPDHKVGSVIFGGRVSHTLPKYYTLGLSALRSSGDAGATREEFGADIWLHPAKVVDITGRSTYNLEKSDWMEHTYVVSLIPTDMFRISADFSRINYKYYFSDTQTSNVFKFGGGVINPNEELTSVGATVSAALNKNFTVSADYKHYEYEIADASDYYGGKLTYSKPDSYSAGASVHRMQGSEKRLRYAEYRMYASKQIENLSLSLDLMDVHYDQAINDVRDAFTASAAVGYRFSPSLKLAADVDYSSNPDYYNEVRTLVKLTYAFDMKYAGEGRAK